MTQLTDSGFKCLDLPAVQVAAQLHTLGPVRTRTPASHASIEQLGRYPQSDDISEAGLVIGEDGLDLRLNLRAWHWVGISLDPEVGVYSLSVFDRHGKLLLCLASTEQSSLAAGQRCMDGASRNRPISACNLPSASAIRRCPAWSKSGRRWPTSMSTLPCSSATA